MQEIKILSPATVANVVCGFDILGFALDDPCDEMTLRLINERAVRITHHDSYNLPTEPEKNIAGAALTSLLSKVEEPIGFEVEITKHIKPGSGIGSSSASAAGAVVAANKLLNDRFSKTELVSFAMDGEALASGARHADNVAPCIYGGFTLVRSNDPLDVIALNHPPLWVTVAHPQIEVKTSDAREILKQNIPLKDAIRQWGNIAALVAGLEQRDSTLISRSLTDHIIEPVRSILIPEFDAIKQGSLRAGALGGGISGSGPSIFMLSVDEETARKVETHMTETYSEIGLEFHTYVSKINKDGVRILSY